MLETRPLALAGVFEIRPKRFGDERGFFSETYSAAAMADAGLDFRFIQDNHSYSAAKGVVRGLHYQLPPAAQDKLVRVSRGSVYDVAVDVREGSATFGCSLGIVLSAAEWNQLFIPKGFAHGFMTLEDHTEVQYKVTDYYSPADERVIRYDDPALGVDWPQIGVEAQLSPRDRNAPALADISEPFVL